GHGTGAKAPAKGVSELTGSGIYTAGCLVPCSGGRPVGWVSLSLDPPGAPLRPVGLAAARPTLHLFYVTTFNRSVARAAFRTSSGSQAMGTPSPHCQRINKSS